MPFFWYSLKQWWGTHAPRGLVPCFFFFLSDMVSSILWIKLITWLFFISYIYLQHRQSKLDNYLTIKYHLIFLYYAFLCLPWVSSNGIWFYDNPEDCNVKLLQLLHNYSVEYRHTAAKKTGSEQNTSSWFFSHIGHFLLLAASTDPQCSFAVPTDWFSSIQWRYFYKNSCWLEHLNKVIWEIL